MNLKTILNYSPNFSSKKRNSKQIKFIIFHYTGMKSESAAIKRLTKIQSEVSSHYFIKNNGKIISMVPDLYIAWHAGVSCWKNKSSLNKNSIGIEISNPGHSFNYKKFSIRQIKSILKIGKFLIRKYKIKPENILGHSDIAPFRKKDPGEKFPWKYLSKNKISFWHNLSEKKIFKERNQQVSQLEKNKFVKNLNKIGYSKNMCFNKNKYTKVLTTAFQRRFRQELVSGIIDQECLFISNNLAKNMK